MVFDHMKVLSDLASCARVARVWNALCFKSIWKRDDLEVNLSKAFFLVSREYWETAPEGRPAPGGGKFKHDDWIALYKQSIDFGYGYMRLRAHKATSISLAMDTSDDEFEDSFSHFLEHVVLHPRLEQLTLACNFTFLEVPPLIHSTCALRKLSLSGSTIDLHELVDIVRSQCKSLEHLDLSNIQSLPPSKDNSEYAEGLHFHGARFVDVLGSCKMLRVLSFKDSRLLWTTARHFLNSSALRDIEVLPELVSIDFRVDMGRCDGQYGFGADPDDIDPFVFENLSSELSAGLFRRTLGFNKHGTRPVKLSMAMQWPVPMQGHMIRARSVFKRAFPTVKLDLHHFRPTCRNTLDWLAVSRIG